VELNPIVALARIKLADNHKKLQDIYEGLVASKLESKVQYGFSGITFKEVGQVLK